MLKKLTYFVTGILIVSLLLSLTGCPETSTGGSIGINVYDSLNKNPIENVRVSYQRNNSWTEIEYTDVDG